MVLTVQMQKDMHTLLDAPHNISFDDLSNNTVGNNNGTQTYIANKLLQVGTYSETIEARASGMNYNCC